MSISSNRETCLEVQNLKKYFELKAGLFKKPNILKAVDDVSFSIAKGETMGLVGESGCGKTTIGRTVLKLYDPTAGKILYDGEDITGLDDGQMLPYRKKIQMIFQDPYTSLDPRMDVAHIIAEPIRFMNLMQGKDVMDRVRQLVELVGLKPDHLNRYPHEFSGGQRQRIGIARALAVRPQLIIADEPVSALDVSIQSQVLNLMSKLKKEYHLTYIFIAHDLSVVEHISDRIGVMYLGNFVEEANKENLYKNPMHPYTQALLSAVPIPDPTVKKERIILEGSIPSAINPPSGCKFHTRCPKCMEICKKEAPKKYQVGEDHFVYCHLYDKENPNVK